MKTRFHRASKEKRKFIRVFSLLLTVSEIKTQKEFPWMLFRNVSFQMECSEWFSNVSLSDSPPQPAAAVLVVRGGACGNREQQGTGVHSCQQAFPETSPRASGATTLLQLPPGDLSPSVDSWKSLWWQVTLAAGGAVSISDGSNLQTDESDCRCCRGETHRGRVAVNTKWQSDWQPLCMLLLRTVLQMPQWGNANG